MFKELPIHRAKYGLMRTILVNILQSYANTNAKTLDVKASYALGSLKQAEAFKEYKSSLLKLKDQEAELLTIRSRYNAMDLGLKTTTPAERLLSDVVYLEKQVQKTRRYISIVEKKKRVKLKIRLAYSSRYFGKSQNSKDALDYAIQETRNYNSKKQWIELFEALTNLKYDNL